MIRMLLWCILPVFIMFGCKKPAPDSLPSTSTNSHLDHEKIGQLLMARMDLRKGESVLMVGKSGDFNSLVDIMREKIRAAGAVYLGVLSVDEEAPETWNTDFTRKFSVTPEAEALEMLDQADIGIMLPGATPADLPYKLFQEKLAQGSGRAIHFHWAGAYDLNGNELLLDSLKDQFYQRVLLQTDYQKLAADQASFEAAMRNQTVRVTTARGTDIRFNIGNRPVTKQDGDASASRALVARNLIDREVELPAGAIRVAPIEETVDGTVAFPDAVWNGTLVKDLVMTFKRGVVTDLKALEGLQAVQSVMEEEGVSARSFREFALGMNPLLAIPQNDNPWIPYYGYGSGVVRLSLGNNQELGGNVGGNFVRWNFFTDANVYVGDSLWVDRGKLLF